METTVQATPFARRGISLTERNWLLGVALVVGSALLFWGLSLLEGSRPREERLVWHPEETSMRFLALSHFLVAFVYSVTSRRMRTVRSWAAFLGLLAVGVLLCAGFHLLGGIRAPLAAALFYLYFLLHEFRDETGFYFAYGDAPPAEDRAAQRREIYAAPLLVLAIIVVTFIVGAAFRIGGARRYTHLFGGMPDVARYAVAILAVLMVIVARRLVWRRFNRTRPGGARRVVRAHRPIYLVFVGLYALLIADILLTGRVYAIVTAHVTCWYVFSLHLLATRPAPDPGGLRAFRWRWLRSTTAGFNLLHGGIAALVIGAAAIWSFGFRNDPSMDAFRWLLSRHAFPYWTILHVSVSWLPR